MDELEYITLNALVMCDQGAAPDFFKPTFNTKVKIHGCLVATNKDATPLINIPSFKVCKINGGPCTPVTAPMTWKNTWQVKINGINSLIGKSTCSCSIGGKIEFMTSGQVPLPEDAAQEVKDMQDQAQRELDDSGQGDSVGEAGLVEGMIPVWGSGRDLINDIQTGDVGGSLLNAGFLIWDVASIAVGVISFGTGTVAMQGAKAGVKGAIKASAKAISKKALQQMGKVGFKKLGKEALKKSVDDVAKKLFKTCVFSCFSAGTPVHTKQGIKNIEDIHLGDLVWSYNEDTDAVALQPVTDLIVNESDHTISIYTEAEVIETTAIHPFYTEEGWKDASELEQGDRILTKDHTKVTVEKIEYSYEPKKVYNFTIAHFHTYFVGMLAWLVHNTDRCLSEIAEEAVKKTDEIVDVVKKKVHQISRSQYRNHTNMIENAVKNGHSTKNLKRGKGKKAAKKNRNEAQKEIRKKQGGPKKDHDYDEFPYASTEQGGRRAHVEEVPSSENQAAGRDLGQFYRENDIKPGDTFDIEIID